MFLFCSDCGVFVASFAEYFVDGKEIPSSNFYVEDHRSRLAVLFYSYGKMKQDENVASETEVAKKSPKKIAQKLKGKNIDLSMKICCICLFGNNGRNNTTATMEFFLRENI